MFWFIVMCVLGPVVFALGALVVVRGFRLDVLSMAIVGTVLVCGGFAFMIVMGGSAFHTGDHTGDGTSVGTVINVAHVGFWWQVDEVYILHRGEMKAEEFGIDAGIVDQAKHFADQGTRVRIHYTSSYICGAWRVANCDVIDRIEPDAEAAEVRP